VHEWWHVVGDLSDPIISLWLVWEREEKVTSEYDTHLEDSILIIYVNWNGLFNQKIINQSTISIIKITKSTSHWIDKLVQNNIKSHLKVIKKF